MSRSRLYHIVGCFSKVLSLSRNKAQTFYGISQLSLYKFLKVLHLTRVEQSGLIIGKKVINYLLL